MNLTIITATVWMVLGWIGLVLLVVYTRRSRRPIPGRPSHRVIPKRPFRQHRHWWQRVMCERLGLHWYPRVRGVAGPLTEVHCVLCDRPHRFGRTGPRSSPWGGRPYYWGGIGWGDSGGRDSSTDGGGGWGGGDFGGTWGGTDQGGDWGGGGGGDGGGGGSD
jgi:hypothetical protein